ncbi:hypothetical protein QOZ80_7BG0589930 [Eleusine coracana subsp. coracana]|nr:hypothetical protein QOZ80_7BG0589930 [Eleusine coracana subsp. coracana]
MNGIINTSSDSILFNGMLHLILIGTRFRHDDMVVAFDREGKASKIICWPNKRGSLVFIGQCQGYLHCISEHRANDTNEWVLSVWVLEDYDTEEWVLKHCVSLVHLFGTKGTPTIFLDDRNYKVVAIHPNGSSVYVVQDWDQKLILYDMNSMEVCALHSIGHGYQSLTPYVPYLMESRALAKKDLYMTWKGIQWVKKGIAMISKVKNLIWNLFRI